MTVYDYTPVVETPGNRYGIMVACERHSGHNGKHVARMGGNANHVVRGLLRTGPVGKGYYSIAKVTWS